MDNPAIPFTPAPIRVRQDGWTVQRQFDFIEALAETGCVADACRRVGMSDTSARNLRMRLDSADARSQWLDSRARVEERTWRTSREARGGRAAVPTIIYDRETTMIPTSPANSRPPAKSQRA